tara:strand:- start:110 stop:409 length:300 start_codon:yes stop_codon:yes gene_type:complete
LIGHFEDLALGDGASVSKKKIRASLNTFKNLSGIDQDSVHVEGGGGVMTHPVLVVGSEFRGARVPLPGIPGLLWKFRCWTGTVIKALMRCGLMQLKTVL